MGHIERPRIGIVVGVGEHRDVNRWAAWADTQTGWFVGKHTQSTQVRHAFDNPRGKLYMIWGADVYACVSALIREALQAGAWVWASLPHMRTSYPTDDIITHNANVIAQRLWNRGLMDHPRIIVTPHESWKNAKKLVRHPRNKWHQEAEEIGKMLRNNRG
jgi:hypothetical protein